MQPWREVAPLCRWKGPASLTGAMRRETAGAQRNAAQLGMGSRQQPAAAQGQTGVWGGKAGLKARKQSRSRRAYGPGKTLGFILSHKAHKTKCEWLQQWELILSQSTGWESKIKVWARSFSPQKPVLEHPSCSSGSWCCLRSWMSHGPWMHHVAGFHESVLSVSVCLCVFSPF